MERSMFDVAYCGSDSKGLPTWKIFKDGQVLTKDQIKDLTKKEVCEIGKVIKSYRAALQV